MALPPRNGAFTRYKGREGGFAGRGIPLFRGVVAAVAEAMAEAVAEGVVPSLFGVPSLSLFMQFAFAAPRRFERPLRGRHGPGIKGFSGLALLGQPRFLHLG
ncbi:hypothetical protein CCS38_16655 [Streptomyces purpurogeneiscleroticus]|nr:hypothetical protein [Streptomyces purpurogeneiscleroticus]